MALFPAKQRFAVWLLPAAAQAPSIAALMADLADTHHGVPFPAHLTLTSGIQGNLAAVTRRFHRAVAGWPAFSIRMGPARHVDAPGFDLLFLPGRRSTTMLALRDRLHRVFRLPPRSLKPHLSLYYGHLGKSAEALATARRLHLERLHIDRVALWWLDGDPDGWRPVSDHRLAARPGDPG